MGKKRVLYIIAGANGSGKTTFAKDFVKKDRIPFINADEIALSLNPSDVNKVKLSAGKKFLRQVHFQLSRDRSFAIESTLSGHYIEGIIKKASKLKYTIHLYYLYLDNPEINIQRIRIRVISGGHHVPDEDVLRRYYRSRQLFWTKYRHLSDSWRLLYNVGNGFQMIAFGNSDDYKVNELTRFQEFLREVGHA